MTSTGAEAGIEEVQVSSNSVAADTPPSSPPVGEPQANGFEALGLSPEILKAVADSGYTIPTPIQAQGIPKVLERRDLIGFGDVKAFDLDHGGES